MAKISLPNHWHVDKKFSTNPDASMEYYSPEVLGSKPEDKAPSGGVKFDNGKPRYDLLPPEYLEATAMVLGFGADKYGSRNWEQGMSWGRVFAALMRHMWAWWRGDKADPETGYSHLWHASCCMAFLVAYEARSVGSDDRGK